MQRGQVRDATLAAMLAVSLTACAAVRDATVASQADESADASLTSMASVASAATASVPAVRPSYGVFYTVWIKAGDPVATVRVRLSRKAEWVRWMRLNADPARYRDFHGTGEIRVEGSTVHWVPPAADAWLQYDVRLESRRESGRYDGYVGRDWALVRADDLVPPVHLDMEDGTQSRAKLDLNLPEGWSAATPFPRYSSGRYRIDNPRRLFDRPTGWIVAGHIGVRRETIGGTRVAVAAPVGQGVHRMDLTAFLRWTLPTLTSLFDQPPSRLLVASAGEPMWRGALSGPSSLFLHADRPMISENATSTVLHELIHVSMNARAAEGADWIVEGLAEFYSLEVLLRSGAISASRYEKAHRDLVEWAGQAGPLDALRSTGATTARAVGVLRRIDAEIRSRSAGRASLDDVLRALAAEDGAVTVARFRQLAEQAAGGTLATMPEFSSAPDASGTRGTPGTPGVED